MRVLRQLIEHLGSRGHLRTHQLDQLRSMGLIEDVPTLNPIPVVAIDIDDLDLTVRSYNCLKREGVHKVSQLVDMTESDLLEIRNFTPKHVNEVKHKLSLHGLSLRKHPRSYLDDDLADAWDAHGDNLLRRARRRARRRQRSTTQTSKAPGHARSGTADDTPSP